MPTASMHDCSFCQIFVVEHVSSFTVHLIVASLSTQFFAVAVQLFPLGPLAFCLRECTGAQRFCSNVASAVNISCCLCSCSSSCWCAATIRLSRSLVIRLLWQHAALAGKSGLVVTMMRPPIISCLLVLIVWRGFVGFDGWNGIVANATTRPSDGERMNITLSSNV